MAIKNWPWNPRSRSWARPKFKVTTWVQHPIDSHPFGSMSIHSLIPMIELFLNLTFKIQGQSHSLRSQSRYNTISTHIPFPCRSALPFLGYSNFKIWPWKFEVKVMGEIKIESHNMGPTFSRLTSLSFHVNRPSFSWDTAFLNLTLKTQGQGQMTMMLHNCRSRQFHRTSNGIKFRDMGSVKSGPSAAWFE